MQERISIKHFQILMPVPVAGAVAGGAIGGVIGGVIGKVGGKRGATKISGKIFEQNISRKCPLC